MIRYRAAELLMSRRIRPAAQPSPCRAGEQLTKLLARFGITHTPGCRCASMAARMDAAGCDWCESEQGAAQILDAMRSEAAKRGLPFLDAAGRLLVRRAISAARKEQRRAQEAREAEGRSPAV